MDERRLRSRVVAEGLVIVTSILLAFAIDAWWDRRGERAMERQALVALSEDFAEADSILAVRVAAIDSGAVAAQAIIDLVGPNADRGRSDSLAVLIPRIIRRPIYEPPMGTLEALLGSGELRLISDMSLRAALASFPSAIADMRETQSFGSNVVFGMLLPFLDARIPMLDFGLMARGESDFSGDPEGLMRSLEFENLAQNRLMGIRFSLLTAETIAQRIASIRAMLREQLGE